MARGCSTTGCNSRDSSSRVYFCTGVPPSLVTTGDFESFVWSQLMRILGTHRARTTAYHPIGNGLVERLHRQLKEVLTFAYRLSILGICTAIKEDIDCASAELVYGATLMVPGELMSP